MKTHSLIYRALMAGALTLAAAGPLPAQPTKTATPSGSAESDASGSIPQSVFVLPLNKTEGRDPFFPDAEYIYGVASPTNTMPLINPGLLTLKGFAGVGKNRLAVINNHSFEADEAGDVLTTAGKIRIRVLEIRNDSVLVEFGNPPQRAELFLHRRF